MKNEIRLVLAGLLILIATSGYAQDKKPRKTAEERSEMMTKKMVKELELDDKQAEAVKSANLEMAREMQEIKEEYKKLKERKIATMKKHEEEMKQVLSEEQYNEYLEKKEERKQHRKEKRADKMK